MTKLRLVPNPPDLDLSMAPCDSSPMWIIIERRMPYLTVYQGGAAPRAREAHAPPDESPARCKL